MSYTDEQAKELYNEAVAYGLDGAELLTDTAAVIKECNGIGADWQSETLRNIFTSMFGYMEVAAAIHDREYEQGGTDEQRAEADKRFYDNVCTVIKATTAWYNPLRYLHLNKARQFYNLLKAFGGLAWNKTTTKDEC